VPLHQLPPPGIDLLVDVDLYGAAAATSAP
jgi:hypothetical protein